MPPKTDRRPGLILLFAEKLAVLGGRPDEHEQTDILTPGLILAPAFPRFRSGCWEFVARHSGATVAGFHGVPCHLFVFKTALSKNRESKAARGKICKRQFGDAPQRQAGAGKYFYERCGAGSLSRRRLRFVAFTGEPCPRRAQADGAHVRKLVDAHELFLM